MSEVGRKYSLTGKKFLSAKFSTKIFVKIFDEVRPKMLENWSFKIVKFRVHGISRFWSFFWSKMWAVKANTYQNPWRRLVYPYNLHFNNSSKPAFPPLLDELQLNSQLRPGYPPAQRSWAVVESERSELFQTLALLRDHSWQGGSLGRGRSLVWPTNPFRTCNVLCTTTSRSCIFTTRNLGRSSYALNLPKGRDRLFFNTGLPFLALF